MIKNSNLKLGHKQRIISKFKKSNFIGWHDYEILEMVLFYAIPRKDTKEISKNLIKKFKTINQIINADENKLKEIEGLGDYSIAFLKMLKELFVKLSFEKFNSDVEDKVIINSTKSAYNIFKFLIGSSKDEQFAVIYLDNSNKIINYEIIATGTINEVAVYPRNLIEKVLNNNAMGIIIAHNHPSGELEPSDFDIELTENIKKSLISIDVILLDHLIVSETKFFSFNENKYL